MKKNAKKENFISGILKKLTISKKEKVLLFIMILLSAILIYSIFKPFNTFKVCDNSNGDYTSVIGPIAENIAFEEKFKIKLNNIDTVSIDFANYGTSIQNGSLAVEIYNHKKELIYKNEYQISELVDNTYLDFQFNPISNVYDKEFSMKLEIKNIDKDTPITFYQGIEDSTTRNVINYDNELTFGGSILIKQTGEGPGYFVSFILIFSLILCSYILGFFRSNEFKTKKIIKYVSLIVTIILSILLSMTIIFLDIHMFDGNDFRVIPFGAFAALSMILSFLIGFYSSNKFKPEKLFIALAIPFGILYMFLIPPGQTPDEGVHYSVVSQVSELNFLQKETKREYLKTYKSYEELNEDLFKKEPLGEITYSAGGYSLLLYLFSGIGMFFAKLFGLNFIHCIYVATFMNVLVYVISGYFIIKYIPFGKYLSLVYLLNPMYLQQTASLSCDVIINAASLLFISFILHVKFNKEKLDTKFFIILCILALFIFNSKFAYFPLLFLLLIILKKIIEYIKENKKIACIIIFITSALFIGTLYMFMLRYYLSGDAQAAISTDIIKIPEYELSKQAYVFSSPIKILCLLYNTLHMFLDYWIRTFAGGHLLWFTLATPAFLQTIFYIMLFISCFFDNIKEKFNRSDKIIMMIITLINICVIVGGLFVVGPPRNLYVLGVQGRYFIPIMILPLLLLNTDKIKFEISDNTKKIVIALTMMYINIYTLEYVINYF